MEALKVLSHFATFFHSLFQIIKNMEAFWKCYCFLQGLFTAWEMKQGLIFSHGNIPKLCLCRFVLCGYLVMWPSVMHDKCSILIGHPFVCEIYTKFGRCSMIMWPSLCAGNSLWGWANTCLNGSMWQPPKTLSIPIQHRTLQLRATFCSRKYLESIK